MWNFPQNYIAISNWPPAVFLEPWMSLLWHQDRLADGQTHATLQNHHGCQKATRSEVGQERWLHNLHWSFCNLNFISLHPHSIKFYLLSCRIVSSNGKLKFKQRRALPLKDCKRTIGWSLRISCGFDDVIAFLRHQFSRLWVTIITCILQVGID